MGSITVTGADVCYLDAPNHPPLNLVAGAALTVGYAVYLDSSGYAQHADADLSAVGARVVGIVVASKDGSTTVASGDRCSVAVWGRVTGFSGMTPGAPVYISKTVGRLDQTAPTSGAYPNAIGRAVSATTIFVNWNATDATSV
jgi:hypothetical protein